MTKKIHIFGDVNKRGEVNVPIELTLKEILQSDAEGMSGFKRVKLVQIGGPLGVIVKGTELNHKLREYVDKMKADTVLFLNDLMCPVDFIRFCTRYIIRELRIKNNHLNKINEFIEMISSGKASEKDFDELISKVNEKVETYAENRLHEIIKYMIENYKDEFMNHIINKKCETGICRRLLNAQCINACPGGVNVPGYVALMTEDKITEAYGLMKQNNPLSFVCGKICARPCETRCRRGEIEKTVGVRALKRYAADMTLNTENFKEDILLSNGKKVAIVGAGPAGLTAAYYLARTGYKVTIFEGNKVVGGMLAVGIPQYRLPQETINQEVKLIKNLGVEIKINTRVGQDIALSEIRKEFDTVFLATGCHIANKFGPDTKGIETAIDLLRQVKAEGRRKIGEKVLVIGGGDVAMDAARTAIRLGAKKVISASLETFETMPASDEEKNEAIEEGIEFVSGYGTKEIKVESGKVRGISLKRCLAVLDDEYKFSPVYDEDDIKEFEVDSLILAIGQRPDNSYLDKDIEVSERGWIKVDPYTFETSTKGIFAAGDMYKPGIAIKAISEAKKAAESIDKYLGGTGLYVGKEIEIPEQQLHYSIWDTAKTEDKVLNVKERCTSFDEIGFTFTKEEAKCEARRCMRCDRNSKQ